MSFVLHCLSDSNIGGAGVFLRNLITAMPENELRHAVLLPNGSRLSPFLTESGVTVYSAPVTPDASFAFRDIGRFYRLFCRYQPAIIHTHGSLAARFAAALYRRAGVLTTRHCAWEDSRLYHGFYKLVSPFTVRLSDLYVATAAAAARDLYRLSVPPSMVRIIPNGSPPKRRATYNEKLPLIKKYGIGKNDFVVTMTCRLSPEKGCDTLLYAARLLLAGSPRYRFFFAGEGTERVALMRLSQELRIADRVHFTGFLEDTAPLLALSHVAVNCSRGTETSSLAISEAMSLAKPVVASHYGGNPYMVKDRESGFLFRTDSPSACAAAIRRLKEEPGVYRQMSEASYRRYCTYFTAEGMSLRYLSLYRTLLADF